MTDYPAPFRALTSELRRLPGIGPRGAERIALWLVGDKSAKPEALSVAISETVQNLQMCACCGFFSAAELCEICSDSLRRSNEICVVEQATDVLPMERTGAYHGLYHVLGGRLSPLDRVSPEDLRIGVLIERIERERPKEIILALSADVEGEATANYLYELIAPLGCPITRLAQGLPAGGGLEHADSLTLQRAFAGRRGVN